MQTGIIMEQTKVSFEEQLQYGKEGEKEIALYLLNKGCSILPLYQFNDELAPKIFTANEIITSPDLTVFKEEKCFFIEVKRKKQWVRFGEIVETGCNYRHYAEYKKVSRFTGIKLFLIFLHENEEPCGKYLIDINTVGRYWNGKVNERKVSKPMYFWNINQLNKLQ